MPEVDSLAMTMEKSDYSNRVLESRINKFADYKTRPVEFVREVLGVEPWAKQRDILRSVYNNSYTCVRSGHGSGKTVCAAMATLWFLETRPGSCVITTAPSGRQVKDLLWRQIRKMFEKAKQTLIGRLMTTQLECGSDWYATGFSTDEPVNFQGPHSPSGVLFVGDEASGLAEWVFDTARGFMTQDDAHMLLIGNPNYASGYFFESFQTKVWSPIHISAFEVPEHVLRSDWKTEMLEEFGEDSPIYQVRVLGEFPFQSENSLFDMKWVERSMDPKQTTAIQPGLPIEIGADIARFGTDESVAFVRAGKRIVDMDRWSGKDTMQSVGRIHALANKWRPSKIKVDVIGMGSGVVDRLKELGLPVVPVNSNSRPKNTEHYVNLRAEQYANLAQMFRLGEIALKPDRKLLGQLVGLTYEHSSTGKRKLIDKEMLRRQGKRSPDRADALMICFADPKAAYVGRALAVTRAAEKAVGVDLRLSGLGRATPRSTPTRGPRLFPARRA